MMDIENGEKPELAVTTVFPSGLMHKPNGCGAVIKVLPAGSINLPFGIIVLPSILMALYSVVAGALIIYLGESFFEEVHAPKPMLMIHNERNKNFFMAI